MIRVQQLNINDKPQYKPYKDTEQNVQKRRVAELVSKYGEDSLAYLTLESDKHYFFGTKAEGFIAYVIVEKVAVCVGDPVCDKVGILTLFKEFQRFCKEKGYRICFCSISPEIAHILKEKGFHISKYGEEALLDLSIYEMTGSKTAKLRQKVRRAERAGILTLEYYPGTHRDLELENKIQRVSEEWFATKNGRLTFTLGELNLDNPLGRRYFVSTDETGAVQAILMFSPFAQGKGFFLDVMRRRQDSVPGVMEKAIIDAAMKMKAEGHRWVSLGLAPLAGIEIEKGKSTLLEKGMHFVYKNMNQGYGFQTLYDYKKKFAPDCWVPRYVAHEPELSALKTAYVMVRARGVEGVLKQGVTGLWEARKALFGRLGTSSTKEQKSPRE